MVTAISIHRKRLLAFSLPIAAFTLGCNSLLGINDLPPKPDGGAGIGGEAGASPIGDAAVQLADSGDSPQGGSAGQDGDSRDAGAIPDAASVCFTGTPGQGPMAKSLGVLSGSGDDLANDVAVDGNNRILVGQFHGRLSITTAVRTETFTAAGEDIFVVKVDATGQPMWARHWGGAGDDGAYSVAVDAQSNIFVAGFLEQSVDFLGKAAQSAGAGDAFLLKLDPDGSPEWVKTWGGAGEDTAIGLAVAEGDPVVTGQFTGVVDFGVGGPQLAQKHDAFLLRTRPDDGTPIWVQTFGGSGFDTGVGVAVGPNNSIAVTGQYNTRIDLGGGERFIYTTAHTGMFVSVRTSSGGHVWSAAIGGRESYASKVAFDAAGSLYAVGSFTEEGGFGGFTVTSQGNFDAFLVRFAAGGVVDWVKAWGGAQDDLVHDVATRGASVYVTGSFYESVNLGGVSLTGVAREGYFARFDACAGNVVWAQAFGGGPVDEGYAVEVDHMGRPVFVGAHVGNVTIGGLQVGEVGEVGGENDSFVVTYPAEGM